MQNILTEMAMLDFETPVSSKAELKFRDRLEDVPSLCLQTPKAAANNTSTRPSTSSSSRSPVLESFRERLEVGDFVQSVQECLCIGKVHIVAEKIRVAFGIERGELEEKVELLTKAMDGEVEYFMEATSPRSSRRSSIGLESIIHCLDCDNVLESITDQRCSQCSDRQQRNMKSTSRFTKKIAEVGKLARCFDDDADSKEGDLFFGMSRSPREEEVKSFEGSLDFQHCGKESSRSKGNRIRHKLQAARDEHHFFEDLS